VEFFRPIVVIAVATLLAVSMPEARSELLRIGGTGMGLEEVRILGAAFAETDSSVSLRVLPSLGSTGGVQALMEGKLDVGLISRPLTESEIAQGIANAACMRTPLAIVTSLPSAPNLSRVEISRMFADPAATWPNGVPVRIVLRSRGESDNDVLAEAFPGMAAAMQSARKRSDVPTAPTDQDNAELLQGMEGSLGAISLLQLRTERLALRTVSIEGVAASVESLMAGDYPLQKTLCLVLPAKRTAGAASFIEFVRSEAGARIVREFGALPVGTE